MSNQTLEIRFSAQGVVSINLDCLLVNLSGCFHTISTILFCRELSQNRHEHRYRVVTINESWDVLGVLGSRALRTFLWDQCCIDQNAPGHSPNLVTQISVPNEWNQPQTNPNTFSWKRSLPIRPPWVYCYCDDNEYYHDYYHHYYY